MLSASVETHPPVQAGFPAPFVKGRETWSDLSRFTWECASSHVRTTAGRRHMDVGWDQGRNWQWVWDSCFMALFAKYAPEALPAMGSLDNFYDLQKPDGHIGMAYDLDSGEELWPERINPPLFLWAESEYLRITSDDSRLSRVLPVVEKHLAWIDANRRTVPHRRFRAKDGADAGRGESVDNFQLYWFEDAGSSGMDDSPRSPRLPEAGRFFDWIDLSSQMALNFRLLSELHGYLGDGDTASEWKNRFTETSELINSELWCERSRFYHDRMLPANFLQAKTVAGFWPLLAGICPPERVCELAAHLENPDTFGGCLPVPSLSRDDPNYDPKGTYWRGGVWAPANYMVLCGLTACGRGDLAHSLAVRYVDGLAETFERHEPHTLWESNAPESHLPGLKPYIGGFVRPDFVGWSGLGPTAILIEHVFGINVNAIDNTVAWDVRLPEEHGIEDLPVGGGHCVSLRISKPDELSQRQVSVQSSKPFTLVLRQQGRETSHAILPGHLHF